jgi:16S rRNA (guanine966-N2)-methyltransferase
MPTLGFGDVVTVRAEPVERALLTGPDLTDGRADLAFLDPPYDLAEDRLGAVLALLVLHRWLAPEALVVVERSARSPQPRWPSGLSAAGERRYGETKVWSADASDPTSWPERLLASRTWRRSVCPGSYDP